MFNPLNELHRQMVDDVHSAKHVSLSRFQLEAELAGRMLRIANDTSTCDHDASIDSVFV